MVSEVIAQFICRKLHAGLICCRVDGETLVLECSTCLDILIIYNNDISFVVRCDDIITNVHCTGGTFICRNNLTILVISQFVVSIFGFLTDAGFIGYGLYRVIVKVRVSFFERFCRTEILHKVFCNIFKLRLFTGCVTFSGEYDRLIVIIRHSTRIIGCIVILKGRRLEGDLIVFGLAADRSSCGFVISGKGYAVTARSHRCFVAVIVISDLSGVRNSSFIMRFYRIVFVIINGIIKVSRFAVVYLGRNIESDEVR